MRFTARIKRLPANVYRLKLSGLLLLFLASSFLFVVPVAHAEGEFETSYDVTYAIDNDGLTTVTQKIKLTNKTPNFYADKFELKIGSTKVINVTALDNTGPLQTEAKFENNLTTISVKFNQKVIGTGKSLDWTLIYSSEELATKSGQIREVSIPRLAKSADIGNYSATVIVPRSFGSQAFAVPKPASEEIGPSAQKYTFNKDQLLASGIAMSFGQKQVFNFKLNYYLENDNVTSQIEQITLPPDNDYQKIILAKMDPAPIDVVVDNDGNFLARYKLSPKQKLDVVAQGSVEVFHKPFRNIVKNLTDDQKHLYLQPQRYWETDNAFIKDKANELKTPEKIYDFVASYLTYSEQRLKADKIERKGAAAAANDPKDSICMEFTDLFIAIARAAGIPTREVTGYAYTQNERLRPLSLALSQGDILHAWPEYWDDERGWIQVDPTWGSTSGGLDYFNKLDFNHITFSQRGLSSTSPQPAGSFKRDDQENDKSVFVEFASELPEPTTNPELSLIIPANIISGIPTKVKAGLKNRGSATIYGEKITLSTNFLKILGSNSTDIAILPPFANRTYEFRLQSANLLRKTSDTLILSFGESQIAKPISIQPFYRLFFSTIFLVATFILGGIIVTCVLLYKKIFRNKKFPFTKSS